MRNLSQFYNLEKMHNNVQQSDYQKGHRFCMRKSSAIFVNRSAWR